jgi:phage repressor protein C with HTH and peptisase S24 domain
VFCQEEKLRAEFHVKRDADEGFAGRLAGAMKANGMNQPRLAAAAGISQGLVSKYYNGRLPEVPQLAALARALGVSAEWLYDGHDPPCRLSLDDLPQPRVIFSSALDQAAASAAGVRVEDFRAVPLVEDAVAAGAARVVSDQIEGWAWVYAPLLGKRQNLVAVRVRGNSMDPVLPEGSVAVVDRGDRRVVRGGAYVVRLDGGVTVKYVRRDGADLVLVPENREHLQARIPAREGEADPIVGRVVWSWRVWA